MVTDRYDVSDLVEAQYEPGSDDSVLRNLLGITNAAEMDVVEARSLADAMDSLIQEYDEEHRFTVNDICYMHKLWLGEIYEWAGHYRQVNIAKGGFYFAVANRVPVLMEVLEREQLTKYTPCQATDRADVVKALAEVHVELELIHPFREGNGRVGRMLSTLMALQAGLPILKYDLLVELRREDYFQAIQEGLDSNYAPMEQLFEQIIEDSIASS